MVLNIGKKQVEEWGSQEIIPSRAFLIRDNKHVKSRSNEKDSSILKYILSILHDTFFASIICCKLRSKLCYHS